MILLTRWMVVCLLLVLSCDVVAELRLPSVLGDHMVLQRDAPVPIWGSADPGEAVTVRFADQIKLTIVDSSGHWRVDLDPMPAIDTPRILYVQVDGQILKRQDILVGDVWLCAGQSNMQMGLLRAADGESEVAKARDPMLRLLRLENHVVPRGEDASGAWAPCTPESAERFSAVGYYFGLAIRKNQDVPVGLIVSAWGATGVESWLPIETIRDEPAFASVLERDRNRKADRPRLEEEHAAAVDRWRAASEAAKASGEPLPKAPRLPMALRPQSQSGSLYDAMIKPLTPYAMRGAVWYQGESNVGQGIEYSVKLERLIESWRQAWSQDRFYFGIVQLPNYRPLATEPGDSDWARLRDAQRLTSLQVPYTGLAVTIDLGEVDNGHPKNKRDVGDRLARLVMADVYGQQLPGHGPVFIGASFDGGAAELTFADGPGELRSMDGDHPGSFAIAGADHQWQWAEVEVIGSRKLRVWSPGVPEPLAVRYAWADNPPSANLTDGTGIPASPFRTDNWPK